MKTQRRKSLRRKGMSAVQWCLIAGAVTLAIIAGISALGTGTNTKLNETAGDIANPTQLKNRFAP